MKNKGEGKGKYMKIGYETRIELISLIEEK